MRMRCHKCGSIVDFGEQVEEALFTNDNDTDDVSDTKDDFSNFDPEWGILFHTIFCKCGQEWILHFNSVDMDKKE